MLNELLLELVNFVLEMALLGKLQDPPHYSSENRYDRRVL
jgi:hypothetical protein